MTAPDLPGADLALAREVLAADAALARLRDMALPLDDADVETVGRGIPGDAATRLARAVVAAQDPAAVERAARALVEVGKQDWDRLEPWEQEKYRIFARAALAAAWGTA